MFSAAKRGNNDFCTYKYFSIGFGDRRVAQKGPTAYDGIGPVGAFLCWQKSIGVADGRLSPKP